MTPAFTSHGKGWALAQNQGVGGRWNWQASMNLDTWGIGLRVQVGYHFGIVLQIGPLICEAYWHWRYR
jgi:hypothetical protein